MDPLNRDPQSGALIRLRGLYPSLKTALQKVANVILRQPEMAVYASVNEVAAASGVSEATVMRFCRILGFKGFQDFKISLAREMVTPSQFPLEEVRAEDDADTIIRKVFQASISALQDTLEVLEARAVRQAVQILLASRRILVCGVGDSGPVVDYAINRFLLNRSQYLWLPRSLPYDDRGRRIRAARGAAGHLSFGRHPGGAGGGPGGQRGRGPGDRGYQQLPLPPEPDCGPGSGHRLPGDPLSAGRNGLLLLPGRGYGLPLLP